MSYAVLRTCKIKTAANAGGLNAHLTRTMDVPNADPELLKYNSRPIGSEDLNADIQKRIKEAGIQPRKNAVLAVENLLTSGAEFFNYHKAEDGKLQGEVNKWRAFEKASMQWLEQLYGKENIVNFTVHKDEGAPHIHAVIVPVVEGKLNCRALLGGREKMRGLQTSFAGAVEGIGLERGIEGSRAKHTDIKEYYAVLKQAQAIAEKAELPQQDYSIELDDIPKLIGQKQWKQMQEQLINQQIKKLVTEHKRMVEAVALIKNENKKLKEQIKTLSSENVKLHKTSQKQLEDIRNIITSKTITPQVKAKYMDGVLLPRKNTQNENQDKRRGMRR
ncbi:hypothetical protein A9P82_08495 [Arachidicoccus ginsenosidimutans]|uniref:MobV family relaxase n=1 Tax=Arachidicoccus sp. BS20 TaxID=1850526 RepID=UPI0007F13F50|nr:MobV family relaxase [Arachidicoccus sp. BS20]ANI89314.1 hypothetical protein A9P82_08425 [Arachidicoccus sp. BS20]ANI89327.1 hypothetical protein A9P82_08495 [Arachidicoccus sp. BS20]